MFLSSGGCVGHGHILLLGWTDGYLRELVLESDGCACCVTAHAMPSAGSVFFWVFVKAYAMFFSCITCDIYIYFN